MLMCAGNRSREGRCRGQAAQLCYQEVRQSAAHQERQEDHRLRPQRRLS